MTAVEILIKLVTFEASCTFNMCQSTSLPSDAYVERAGAFKRVTMFDRYD